MKKLVLIFSAIFMAMAMSFAQPNDCTLQIGSVDATGYNAGDYIDIPVTMPQVDGVVMGWEFYILFDNTMFSANMTVSDPNYFLQNKTTLFPGSWFENINPEVQPGMNQFAANWLDPTFTGVTVPPTEVLFNLHLMYNGGLGAGETSAMTWNFSSKKANNYQIKGVTAVVNGSFAFYNIIPIDGGVFLPGGGGANTWTNGTGDGMWFTDGNWSAGHVPMGTEDVDIPDLGKAAPVVIGGSAVVGGVLHVFAGAEVDVVPGGDLTTNGAFNNDGILKITSDNTGASGSFIDNNGITPGPVSLFEFDRDQKCVGGALPYGSWHYLASPVVSGFDTWDMFDYYVNAYDETHSTVVPGVPEPYWIHIAGSLTIPCTPAPQISLTGLNSWAVNMDPAYLCNATNPGTGQVVEMMGDPGSPFNSGAMGPVPYTYTPGTYQGYNMFGNPYPSAIDPSLITYPANMDNGVYMWDPCGNAGMGQYWPSTLGNGWNPGPGIDGNIPPTQGFFVHVTGAGNFSLNGTERVNDGNANYWKSTVSNLLMLKASAGELNDYLYVRFMDDASQGHDKADMLKMFVNGEGIPQIYTTEGSEMLSVNALPATNMVPMGFTANGSGTYTIEAIETSDFANVVLEDLENGVQTDLLQGSYSFNYTSGVHNFMIHFTPLGTIDNVADNITISSENHNIYVNVPGAINGDIAVYNMMGQEVIRVDMNPGLNTIPMHDVNSYYIVKVISDAAAKTGKVFIR